MTDKEVLELIQLIRDARSHKSLVSRIKEKINKFLNYFKKRL